MDYQVYHECDLGAYTAKTFSWMALGLLTTFSTAFLINTTSFAPMLYTNPAIPFLLLLAEVILVSVLSSRVHTLSVGAARCLFFVYSILNSVTFAGILFLYDLSSLVMVFGFTALYFSVLAAYGYFTKRDLTKMRPFLTIALGFLVLYWLISLFLPMTGFDRIMCLVGLVIFMGFTAYDTRKIRDFYEAYGGTSEMAQKLSILSALELYLDFINLFLYMVRLIGRSRD